MTDSIPRMFSSDLRRQLLHQGSAGIVGSAVWVALTNPAAYPVPVITDDPVASWVAEGAEIPVDDLGLDEVVIQAYKLIGLSFVTNELLADSGSDPAVEVGRDSGSDIAKKIDAPYFGASITNGPSGSQDCQECRQLTQVQTLTVWIGPTKR